MLLLHNLFVRVCVGIVVFSGAATVFARAQPIAQDQPTVTTAGPVAVAPDPLAPLPQIPAGQARIFFFRKPQFTAMAADARIAIDGATSGWVGGGSAVFVDHPAGSVIVSVGGGGGLFGTAPVGFEMALEPGKEYFVGLAARAAWVSVGGVLPFLITAGVDAALNKDIPARHCGIDWCAAEFAKLVALPTLSRLSISGPNPNAD